MRRWGMVISGLAVMLVLTPAGYSGVQGQQDSPAQAEIRALLGAQQAAWNRGDIAEFMTAYWKSERTEFVGASGVQRGWQAVFNRYRRTYPDRKAMGQLTFSDLEITVLAPDAAYIVGRWRLERETDHPDGVFTLIAKKYPDGWRIVHDHTSAFTALAAN